MSAAEEIPVRAFEPDEIPAARRAGYGEGQPGTPAPAAAGEAAPGADDALEGEQDLDHEHEFDEPGLELDVLGGDLDHEDPVAEAEPEGESVPPAAAPTTYPLRRPPRQGGPHAEAHARARELFARLNELPEGSTERKQIRDELVQMHLPLVEHLARRFRNRGEPLDDLTQVATIGLIKSVDRFDTERGVEFSTYATPTVIGEIKRHFRDKGWAVRVPRRLQELRLSLTSATSELSQRNRRSPTVAELAEYLKISEEEVLEGLESANAYSTLSLDVSEGGDEDSPAVADSLGSEDEALEGVEYRESLKPLLEQLPPREKKILLLRFFGNMTQSQIAEEIGISQMHVSRLLARTLEQLRAQLLVDE
ncbi:RNA polymerase sigma factor SigF [Catenulispora pinisilvae]|uniref:RNA polymerase sigma factor SigF n=1 Tax=Catenulispora pinisilvae TaxID=2705253 RepID=UPI002B265049|nr:RNA polymerase sigma factor SigF [Catenulispora pinisilvae]